MPMHDWARVPDGIFHAFHQGWITVLSNTLNSGLLPPDLYALPEQTTNRFTPDVLTLQASPPANPEVNGSNGATGTGGTPAAVATTLQTRPATRFTAEEELGVYPRRKSAIAVRHVSGDRIVALLEIVSPGNKSGQYQIDTFVRKACDFIENGVHLLVIDPHPPGPRDPDGVHALIWREFHSAPFRLPPDKPLTLAAYECGLVTRAYVETLAVGDPQPNMPLFLVPNGCIMVPLEATYQAAFAAQPRRWRDVLQPPG
jgi:hypothetical protein